MPRSSWRVMIQLAHRTVAMVGCPAMYDPILSHPDMPDPPSLTAEQMRACVLYQDDDLFIVNKPSGLAVHKAGRFTDNLGLYLPWLVSGDERTPRLAHRLDRDTAGCLVLGRADWALKRLGDMFAAGHVEKIYWAVAVGAPPADSGVIDLPLLKRNEPGNWAILAHPDGQPALTEYRLLGQGVFQGQPLSWLELRPRTGRTHQLRVHCAAVGCPLLGEPFYGPTRLEPGNLHLLARSISFQLAFDRSGIEAVATPPGHMHRALTACGWQPA